LVKLALSIAERGNRVTAASLGFTGKARTATDVSVTSDSPTCTDVAAGRSIGGKPLRLNCTKSASPAGSFVARSATRDTVAASSVGSAGGANSNALPRLPPNVE
jgi:hypothetical protein